MESPIPPDVSAEGRDPLGRAHQLRVDIAIVLSLLPSWVWRAIVDRNPHKARSGRMELVERIGVAIERRFRVTWLGSADDDPDARAPDRHGPLFGGPHAVTVEALANDALDSTASKEGT